MSPIAKGDLVLITGASGFVAAHITNELLRSGYRVRGTVRSAAKGEYLRKLYHGQPFEYVIIKDVEQDGALDEAVKGIDAAIHPATPCTTTGTVAEEFIGPAVKGTTELLYAMQKYAPGVKAVVFTSSTATIQNFRGPESPEPWHETSADRNVQSVAYIENNPPSDPMWGVHAYMASKVKAEQAFWEFMEVHKPTWQGTVINPPWIFGPVLHDFKDVASLNLSSKLFWDWVSGEKGEKDLPGPIVGGWVDVRDVAIAHVRALERRQAASQRYIVCGGTLAGQHWVDVLHAHYPDHPLIKKNTPVGVKGSGDEAVKVLNTHDQVTAQEALGLEYTSLEQCTKDMFETIAKKLGVFEDAFV
ncbi:hypothetical protein L202_04305 [Cryptococcus amylolentus CBS 6039]|uniref:NAD-dependent epimerase/dehydratase domain-containing protein n=2 Tax=Cryptococcus amylolentus TaxID=104669 RepID=A0A1E3HR09_9TREE|nr:hypothetical protein L202_04305 [Cryptococcus amylolentus CBS 6039]ODN78742.1 hypothetical protein L202_04305 [Cryptococcus amylolentus CBS 6039]ODO06754.1 hypothetical protein I350_04113 [Cryptococcus amylolentus CBS 6273]